MHQFIENYFKDSLDSIKSLHQKINQQVNQNLYSNQITHTIYYDEGTYYAMINDDYTTAKHLSCFNIADLLNMKISSNIDKNLLDDFIVSTF